MAAALSPGLPSAFAQDKRPQGGVSSETLPDYDARNTIAPRGAALSAEGGNFARKLASAVDAAGNPVRYSLSAEGWPRMISADAGLTGPSSDAPEWIARRFLASSNSFSTLTAADVAAMRLRRRSSAGGLEVLFFEQYTEDLPVYGASAKAAIDRNGQVRLVAFASLAPGIRLANPVPALSAAQAVRLVMESLQVEAGGSLESLPTSGRRTLFAHPAGSRYLPITAELTAFPVGGGQARLAWRVFADAVAGSYEVVLAADDGQLLLRQEVMSELGSARVFPDTPLHPSEIRELRQEWLPADAVVTTGNNIDAYLDRNADDSPDSFSLPGVNGGRAFSETQLFDFPTGTGQNAGPQFAAAAITNAFYHGNFAHDFFYELGFREPEGNFQSDNFGRGGEGGDAPRMEVQDGDLRNNANYTPRPDGLASRIQLGLWTSQGQARDFAYDGTAIVHEYAHGVTNRLIGGPDNISCLAATQADALSEGWSDYFGASAYEAPVFGDYITGDAVKGIRRARIDQNPRTFADLGSPRFQEHADGEIWASTLWDIRKALGTEKADTLIAQALSLTPCAPTYVDARDAILAAGDGTSRAALWAVFAARGLGFGASAGNASIAVRTLFNASFDLPPDLAATGNRPPRVTSVPPDRAVFGEPYSYEIRSVDLDGDAVAYALVSGPAGVAVDPATGRMTWPSPTFTSHRIQIAATDGKGGRTLHGFELRVDANLTLGQPIQISGVSGSLGYAYVDVKPGTEIFQVKMRGAVGQADLYLFTPQSKQIASRRSGVNETLSIVEPQPGEWTVAITGSLAYENVSLSAETLAPVELPMPGAFTGLSDARSGERFFKVAVPEATPLLRVTLAGRGDPDLLLAKGRIPLCAGPFVTLPCDTDQSSEGAGGFEVLALENPPAGNYYLTVYGFQAFRDAGLRVSSLGSSVEIDAAVDAAAYRPGTALGGIVSVFGEGLAGVTETASSFPLPVEMGGVRVSIEGVEAPLFFISPTQINFQFPYRELPVSTPLGAATMIVDRNGELSDPMEVPFDLSAPQVFVNPATMLPVATHLDGSLIAADHPARPGEAITIYFTGIGLVSGAPRDGEPAQSSPLARTLFDARATLGEQEADVLFAGLSPGSVGLAQVNLVLPDALPEGETLPLVLTFDTGASAFASAPVNLPVSP